VIRGLGIDLVENSRIKKIYDSYGYRFVKRILDNNEIKEFNISENKISFLAKRFASKEALSKSLGLGLYRKNLYPNTIRIDHDNYGKPFFTINETLSLLINQLEITNILLSISDTTNYSTAIVIVENNEN
tara:strand:- start:939 stop:1328 length:390 start_codon:yes stop_codon:yes gene_type:complete